MGQTESLKKIRGLRKDIARVKTILRRAQARSRNGEKIMAETTQKPQGRRKEVVGEVVSNRMQKTIVVQVTRKKAHPFYGRVIARQQEVLCARRERTRRTSATWCGLKRRVRCRS